MTYNEGGKNDSVHKLPTRMKHPNLVLKRGVTTVKDLQEWAQDSFMGPEPQGDHAHDVQRAAEKVRTGASRTPTRSSGPGPFNAGQNTVATEAIEIAHDGIQVVLMARPAQYIEGPAADRGPGADSTCSSTRPSTRSRSPTSGSTRRSRAPRSPQAQFGGGNPRELTLNLLLDASLLGKTQHVRGITDQLFRMMEVPGGSSGGSTNARRRSSPSPGAARRRSRRPARR